MSESTICHSCHKRCFVEMDQARMAAAIQWKYDGVALWIYPCPHGAGFYLTKSPPRPATARRHDQTRRRWGHRSHWVAGRTASGSGAR